MRLFLSRLKESAGYAIDFDFNENIKFVQINHEDIFFIEPVRIQGSVENMGNRIFEVHGVIKTAAEYPCFRCLTMTRVDLNLDFSLKFSDIPVDSQEDEIIAFSGDEIEITPYILDEIMLNWPGQILCKPDCRGICPHCGADLNKTTCSCKQEDIDPRLAALQSFLK